MKYTEKSAEFHFSCVFFKRVTISKVSSSYCDAKYLPGYYTCVFADYYVGSEDNKKLKPEFLQLFAKIPVFMHLG